MQFDENKHPRDGDGKFTAGHGMKKAPEHENLPSANRLVENYEKRFGDVREKEETKADKQRVIEYVNDFRSGKNIPQNIQVSLVGDRERNAIENLTNEKLKAKVHSLSADELRHIENRHGLNGRADKTMKNSKDYANIVDTLQHFDTIDYCYRVDGTIDTTHAYMGKDGKPAKLIKYERKTGEKVHYTVEAVVDGKAGDLKIISAYSGNEKEQLK